MSTAQTIQPLTNNLFDEALVGTALLSFEFHPKVQNIAKDILCAAQYFFPLDTSLDEKWSAGCNAAQIALEGLEKRR